MTKKTTPLQNAIIISSLIGTLLSEYSVKENTKIITLLKRRIHKFMYSRSRTNKKEFLEALRISEAIWKQSINHFAKKKTKLEVISTVIRLHDLYSTEVSRFANIREEHLESLSANQSESTTQEIELDSYEVADYILNELSSFTGVERRKLNLLQRIKIES